MHTVKEAARITGLTEHAVRFYTDKGLVPSVLLSGHFGAPLTRYDDPWQLGQNQAYA
ncbi:UNVERIFIED_CONTAM: hypothetical protein ABID48_005856 [Paenibacillus phyllosphaerae]